MGMLRVVAKFICIDERERKRERRQVKNLKVKIRKMNYEIKVIGVLR